MRTKMQTCNVGEELDRTFVAHGTESRKQAEYQTWEEYDAPILLDARKESAMTQSEVADKIGADKGCTPRVEGVLTIPTISTFYRMVSAMGLTVELR